jgi:hypothetical protein
MSGWLVENNTFVDCQTAMLLGGGRDARVVGNTIESCGLGLHYDNRGMTWEHTTNCVAALAGLNRTLAGPAGAAYARKWPEMLKVAGYRPCDPVNDTIANNTYVATPRFCDTTPITAASWGSVMNNNTDLSPTQNTSCPLNTTARGRPYIPCSFRVSVSRSDQPGAIFATITLQADRDDCFRVDGCSGTWGPSGRTCESTYKDSARLVVTTNGTVVGEGTCCVPSVQNSIVAWERTGC